MTTQARPSILFVCLGNICRSPLAEGVFRQAWHDLGEPFDLDIDSAGTGGWHAGSAPDPRSVAIAAAHGVDISTQRARRIEKADFARHTLILGMDRSNVETLRGIAPSAAVARIALFMDHALGDAADIPDPYYGGADGFAGVYRMIQRASEALASRIAAPDLRSASGHASSTI